VGVGVRLVPAVILVSALSLPETVAEVEQVLMTITFVLVVLAAGAVVMLSLLAETERMDWRQMIHNRQK
jgi:hypothetical protein